MAEWLKEPGFVGTHATMGADVSQLMATVFTVLFIIGWVQARGGKGNRHHGLMLGGMVAMLAFFTSYYLFRQLGVLAFEGKEGFGGSRELYHNVFVPLLTFHIILVVIGLIMAIFLTRLLQPFGSLNNCRRLKFDNRLKSGFLYPVHGFLGGKTLTVFRIHPDMHSKGRRPGWTGPGLI